MEQKNISFGYGIRRTPSIGEAGELSEAMNIMPSNGELVSIQQPTKSLVLNSSGGETVLAVHRVRTGDEYFDNYITAASTGVYYNNSSIKKAKIKELTLDNPNETSVSISGSILLILCGETKLYFAWDGSTYKDISCIPEPNFTFGLHGGWQFSESEDYSLTYSDYSGSRGQELVMGVANKFLEEVSGKGYFTQPFYIRAAYELFDGTIYKPTPPVLLIPDTSTGVHVLYTENISGNIKSGKIRACAYCAKPGFGGNYDANTYNKIIETGLVKCLNIYVSEQITKYDQSGKLEDGITNHIGDYCYTFGYNSDTGMSYFGKQEYKQDEIYKLHKLDNNLTWYHARLPEKNRDYSSVSNFYKIIRIELTDIISNSNFEPSYFTSKYNTNALATLERLEVGVVNNDLIFPLCAKVYNNRFCMFGVRRELFSDIQPYNCINYDDCGNMVEVDMIVGIKENNKNYYVKCKRGKVSEGYFNSFFYPNRKAFAVWFYNTEKDLRFEIELTAHPFLDMAYYVSEGGVTILNQAKYNLPIETGKSINELDKIYLTSVSNPFTISQVTSIQSSIIKGIETTAKALSQGQFGQFPLYAFCEDGIWALEISDTGLISAKQPVSRDVVTDPNSITQLDDAVAFITKEGLKVISGSDVALISEKIHGLNVDESFVKAGLNKMDGFDYGTTPTTSSGGNYRDLYFADTDNFIKQIQSGCTISYDYPHQLLHVFLTGKTWHYVYSRKNQEWSKQTNVGGKQLVASVPGYPLSTLQFGTDLYQYDTAEDSKKKGFVLTRSYAFDNPYARKCIYDLRMFAQKHTDTELKIIVYESNDNINWQRMKSLKYHSAKFYRFLICSDMYDTDTITGMALLYDERYTNKLR